MMEEVRKCWSKHFREIQGCGVRVACMMLAAAGFFFSPVASASPFALPPAASPCERTSPNSLPTPMPHQQGGWLGWEAGLLGSPECGEEDGKVRWGEEG